MLDNNLINTLIIDAVSAAIFWYTPVSDSASPSFLKMTLLSTFPKNVSKISFCTF